MHTILAPSLACSCLYIVQLVCRFIVKFRKHLQEPWEKETECSLGLLLCHMDSLICPCLNMGEMKVQPSRVQILAVETGMGYELYLSSVISDMDTFL